MNDKKYLHLMLNEKFNTNYIKFIEKNFDINNHKFIFSGGISENQIPIYNHKNIKVISNKIELFKLIKFLKKSDEIFFHSFFSGKYCLLLYLNPWFWKKCNWIIWGGDLYCYRQKSKTFKSKFFKVMKCQMVKRFGVITTLVPGDYDLAKKWYKVRGQYKSGIYMGPLDKKPNLEYIETNNKSLHIQLGNSGSLTNNHIEALKILEKYKNENIKIFCPLSYGNKKNIEDIIKVGKQLFGEKFIPITGFMPYEEYLKYLSSIDIGIFNNDRQEALGNINQLILKGKKVFVKTDTSMYSFFKETMNTLVFDIEKINNLSFENFKSMNKVDRLKNIKNMSYRYTNTYAYDIWKKHFE